MSSHKARFDKCRERLWKLLANVDYSYGCKSYEGAITVELGYPRYFDSPEKLPDYDFICIHLDCYVLGPYRHYDFKGCTFSDAITKFEGWLNMRENERKDGSG